MKKNILGLTLAFLLGTNLVASPNNVATLTDIKESIYYLILDYKKIKSENSEYAKKLNELKERLDEEIKKNEKLKNENHKKFENIDIRINEYRNLVTSIKNDKSVEKEVISETSNKTTTADKIILDYLNNK
ncbi:hypothetical protein CP985_03430 [Malaciobacter mytili LMG 24559]|uniref:Adhesion protein FadA n=1 Tax=Malaciobacter mytili LMG 24559 TaxID=1032238 RepID=A0AAX2AJT2_9BACT|nr:hypothetical protein [Malaciobacter mytili]AXH16409.1 hypothetical protein AMYT_a0111 [Malaciobacter mytili LMG 24559]RXK16476.1 hypothetical protein CP985_03430 [Malaciobacter mytili LMG 24559]